VPVSFAVGGVLYLTLLWFFPEPDSVHGPQGRRLVGALRERSRATAPVPVPITPRVRDLVGNREQAE
jgi:hypothetical protein